MITQEQYTTHKKKFASAKGHYAKSRRIKDDSITTRLEEM
jgi:hypothetical protein